VVESGVRGVVVVVEGAVVVVSFVVAGGCVDGVGVGVGIVRTWPGVMRAVGDRLLIASNALRVTLALLAMPVRRLLSKSLFPTGRGCRSLVAGPGT